MVKKSIQYICPIPKDFLRRRVLWKKWLWYLEQFFAGTHKGNLEYALDFMEKRGTPVLAAEAGKVVFVDDGSTVGGPFKQYWNKGNRVVIKHISNEFTAYEHFDSNTITVKKGDVVRKGHVIGYVGRTGFVLFSHLHFELFVDPDISECEGRTIKVGFSNF